MRTLLADIGGTKTLLRLVVDGEIVCEQRYQSQKYPTFIALARDFLQGIGQPSSPPIKRACIAVAGPVEIYQDHQSATVTNLPWQLDSTTLESQLNIQRVLLINDFHAQGLGVSVIGKDQLVILQQGKPIPHDPSIVVGAGTGLGIAQLIWLEDRCQVICSEGGHSNFAPADEQQLGLLAYLFRSRQHVSIEHVLSGPGLVTIYNYLLEDTGASATTTNAVAKGGGDPAAAIVASAEDGTDSIARAAIKMFVSIYGAVAGDLALLNLARGGVYLAGGIAPKIIPHLTTERFLSAFLDKGPMTALLRTVPVYIVTTPDIGLLGARVAAIQDSEASGAISH